jgi:hypothetical protein
LKKRTKKLSVLRGVATPVKSPAFSKRFLLPLNGALFFKKEALASFLASVPRLLDGFVASLLAMTKRGFASRNDE